MADRSAQASGSSGCSATQVCRASVLARSLPPDSDQQELTGIIISEVDRLKSLVDSMLGSHRRPVLQPVNVHEPLERVLSLLQSQSGDSVRFVDRADDGEYAGWKWAVANDGRAGWVPREWFSAGQGSAIAQRSYSARELAANAGDQILELDRFSGWIWAITPGGQTGWLPAAATA